MTQKNKDDIVRFKQFDKEVRGKVHDFLPGGNYQVELLDDAPPLRKGMIISLNAANILD